MRNFFFYSFFFFLLEIFHFYVKRKIKPCIKFQEQEDSRSVLKMKQIECFYYSGVIYDNL